MKVYRVCLSFRHLKVRVAPVDYLRDRTPPATDVLLPLLLVDPLEDALWEFPLDLRVKLNLHRETLQSRILLHRLDVSDSQTDLQPDGHCLFQRSCDSTFF